MAGNVRLELKPDPDGFDYRYGEAVTTDGKVYRVNILPPLTHWRGDIKPGEIDATQWIVYIDGDEVARVARREDIDSLDLGTFVPRP